MTDRTKYIDGIPVGLTDQDGTDSRFSVDVHVTSGSISSSGATEYTEGDVDASITGTAIMWEDTGDTLRAVSVGNSLPVNVTSGSITIEIGDIQIGAVEIKDHDSTTRLDVEAVTLKNALFDQSEDGAHVTTGAIADVVVVAGAAGTLSAKLRAISRDIDATNTAIALLAELTETQPVSVADGSDVTQGSLVDAPAARDAYEDITARTQTALLKGIKNVLRDVVAAQLPDSHNVTIDNAGVGAAVNIQDGGNSITIDGTIAVSSGSVDVLSLPPDTFVAEGGALGKGVLIQGDDGTDRKNVQVNPDGDLRYHSNWAPSLQADEAANDSDKEFTVTVDKEWHLMWLWVEFASSGSTGNRQVEVQLKDGSDDVLMQLQAGATQAASLTRNYLFAPGTADLTAFRDTSYLTTPIPPTIILPASYDIRVWDNNAVANNDDMTLQMMVLERTA